MTYLLSFSPLGIDNMSSDEGIASKEGTIKGAKQLQCISQVFFVDSLCLYHGYLSEVVSNTLSSVAPVKITRKAFLTTGKASRSARTFPKATI